MKNNNENNGFQYTYSASEQAELKKLREKYETPQKNEAEDKMERLRRLDAGVTQKAQTVALIFGVIGTLILGFGMSLIMTDLATMLGLPGSMAMLLGVLCGVVGGVLACLAYPLYQLVLRNERKRIAPEILKLTDELMK